MSIFCSLIREECNIFHSQSTVKTLESASQLPYRHMENFFERTKVTMYPVSEEEIRDYIAGGEPMDKAGAYAIQGLGAKFIQKIEGDYNNVVGLPIGRIYQEIKRKSIEIPTRF